MDIRRVMLYAVLSLVVYSLWMNWQHDYVSSSHPFVNSNKHVISNTELTPNLSNNGTQERVPNRNQDKNSFSEKRASQSIQVKTDVLNLQIDLSQGDIVNAQLLNYPVSVDEKNTPITLLTNQFNNQYVVNSSLFTNQGQSTQTLDFGFSSTQNQYELPAGKENLTITLLGKTSEGLEVKKEFVFTRGSYLIQVHYFINNQGKEVWKGYMNTQLLRNSPQEDKSSLFHVGSYTGASYSNPGEHRYKKVSFKDMAKANLDVNAKGGWVAMQQHYFVSAWIPRSDSQNMLYTRVLDDSYIIGVVSRPIVVEPAMRAEIGSELYLGPEDTSVLKAISPGLDLTVDYGWLWFLSSLLFSFMKVIHSLIGNWGWSIVLVTILIKLAFYRLSATSYKSMAGMRKLQPKIQALRDRYGDDKSKISQATMELYRQEKVNPLGGCLPIVIQIPVFIALYWVLLESVELRQASFIFWIKDLASADPFHVLPIIMGITMLIQQRLNPAPPDPMQAKVMMFLPILFTGLFWNFPAGLVLYWIVNNTLSILQQWYITQKYGDNNSLKK